jgi:hypothetical protein
MTSVINISRNSRINWSVNSLYLYHVYSRGAACRTSQAAASSCSQVAAVRMHFTGKKLQELVHIPILPTLSTFLIVNKTSLLPSYILLCSSSRGCYSAVCTTIRHVGGTTVLVAAICYLFYYVEDDTCRHEADGSPREINNLMMVRIKSLYVMALVLPPCCSSIVFALSIN